MYLLRINNDVVRCIINFAQHCVILWLKAHFRYDPLCYDKLSFHIWLESNPGHFEIPEDLNIFLGSS